jgi:hypothetical protein
MTMHDGGNDPYTGPGTFRSAAGFVCYAVAARQTCSDMTEARMAMYAFMSCRKKSDV